MIERKIKIKPVGWVQTSVLYKHRCRNFCTIAKLSPQVQKRLHLCYIFAQVPVSKQINLAIRMFGNWRLLFKLDLDTPSINKCTGEIDVMEPLVETILTLVYSIIRATIKVHRWIQAPVHMRQWRFHIWGFKRWQRILDSVNKNSEDMFRGSISW